MTKCHRQGWVELLLFVNDDPDRILDVEDHFVWH